jgi:hypothetical protein
MKLVRFSGAVVALIAFATFGFCSAAMAQSGVKSQKQLDIAAARAERKATVGENMHLTAAESKVFWPLYDKYEAGMDKIEDRHIREIKNYVASYRNLTDDDANRKLDEVMSIQEARLELQKTYVPKFRAIMSPIKVTRFFQIDNKLRAMVQCGVAEMVPLAEPAAREGDDSRGL